RTPIRVTPPRSNDLNSSTITKNARSFSTGFGRIHPELTALLNPGCSADLVIVVTVPQQNKNMTSAGDVVAYRRVLIRATVFLVGSQFKRMRSRGQQLPELIQRFACRKVLFVLRLGHRHWDDQSDAGLKSDFRCGPVRAFG